MVEVGLSDLNFLFRFLPIFLILYFLCPVKYRNVVLCLSGILFCALSSPAGAAVLCISITVNYVMTCLMDCRPRFLSGIGEKRCWRRAWLFMSLLFNVGLLCYYKYRADALPPGISFYTFTLLSMDIDVFLRREKPARNLMEAGAFAAMFPKLLSGPITAYSDLMEQIRRRKSSAKDRIWSVPGDCRTFLQGSHCGYRGDSVA